MRWMKWIRRLVYLVAIVSMVVIVWMKETQTLFENPVVLEVTFIKKDCPTCWIFQIDQALHENEDLTLGQGEQVRIQTDYTFLSAALDELVDDLATQQRALGKGKPFNICLTGMLHQYRGPFLGFNESHLPWRFRLSAIQTAGVCVLPQKTL